MLLVVVHLPAAVVVEEIQAVRHSLLVVLVVQALSFSNTTMFRQQTLYSHSQTQHDL
jgi:hypothetical protein